MRILVCFMNCENIQQEKNLFNILFTVQFLSDRTEKFIGL